MADSKISALTDGATADATDRIPVARSPFASGDNRYITPAYLATYLAGTLTADRVVYGQMSQSANLTYSETSGPRLQVGSGSAATRGILAGYSGTSGASGVWPNDITPSTTVGLVFANTAGKTVLSNTAGTHADLTLWNDGEINFTAGSSVKMALLATAGRGPSITAGSATTDVNALSATQTWNASGVSFTGWKFTITDTASAAGSLARQTLGGASGTTSLEKLTKAGDFLIPGYISHTEMTAPAGASNEARIFAQDNGAGKTQLMVIFGSGVAQQIAIEA